MTAVEGAVDHLRYYLRAWRSWVRAWRAPLGLPAAVPWLRVMPPTPSWNCDDGNAEAVDGFILRAINAEVENLPTLKRAAVRQVYLNESLASIRVPPDEVRRLCSEAEFEMVPRLRLKGVVLGDT